MTIQSAFNEITETLGGTPSTDGTITGAIDALNDTLAGENQERGNSIEDAVRLLGEHIGSGDNASLTGTLFPIYQCNINPETGTPDLNSFLREAAADKILYGDTVVVDSGSESNLYFNKILSNLTFQTELLTPCADEETGRNFKAFLVTIGYDQYNATIITDVIEELDISDIVSEPIYTTDQYDVPMAYYQVTIPNDLEILENQAIAYTYYTVD